MVDRASLQRWLDAYVEAWRTYDPDKIRGLFTEDARYFFHPMDTEPVSGRDAILANWLESQDAPGSWTADYRSVATDGEVGIAQGLTKYSADPKTGRPERTYANLWVIRFAPDGRCREFTEWFMQPRESS